jgi:hypothetical protein
VNRFPISFGVRPCTNELVDLSGMAITLLETTPDGNHFFFHSNDIGVTGLGQTTGVDTCPSPQIWRLISTDNEKARFGAF